MEPLGRVQNEVAIVTGGALGIGQACAKMLAAQGAYVAIFDVLDSDGQRLADEIGDRACYFHVDVSNEDQVRVAVGATAAKFGKISILVNNAGISGANKPVHEITSEEWDKVMNVNVKGVFLCTKYTVPHMLKNGKGSIVNLSSIYGLVGAPDVPPYHASKGAVRLMTKTDALTYAKQGIRANSVHPGYIWTPMVENHLKTMGNPEELRAGVGALHPIGHMGDVDDIAYGVVYLASDESKFVTGSELVIDGGYTAQ